ncbi:hypothetical protein BESB_058350 [Besnoitia besnoiti]|uniref:Uncharacterized protein n=1 Tax=Besnoitia besnoiti TaxID=94643 RepID=A0A2A9M8Y4_BESBE|nr:hypothetical protein BESB_058350 [Besnoitia besnoiti]PFH34948.1 hypothetical protein BESB_058350 [Besnoitia besnoiti]
MAQRHAQAFASYATTSRSPASLSAAASAKEQLAAAYATSLSGSGLASLSHPLYARLYRADALAAASPTADGAFLQDILELCPLQTPAATLVETKLSNRALRLDTLRPSSASSAAASSAAASSAAAASAGPLALSAQQRRRLLKLSRTRAKRLGLFDVKKEIDASSASAAASRFQRRGMPRRAPGGEARFDLRAEDVAREEPMGEGQRVEGDESAEGEMELEGVVMDAVGGCDAEMSEPTPLEASSSSEGVTYAPSSAQPLHPERSPLEALLASSFAGLRFEHFEGLNALWLQYLAVVCGAREALALPADPREAAAAPLHPPGPAVAPSSASAAAEAPFLSKKARREERKSRDGASWQKAFDRCTGLSKADLHGARVKVVRSKTPGLVGKGGFIVEETQQSLLLLGDDQVLRRVMKSQTVLSVESLEGSTFFLHTQHLQHSGVGRSKTKLKPKQTLLLP